MLALTLRRSHRPPCNSPGIVRRCCLAVVAALSVTFLTGVCQSQDQKPAAKPKLLFDGKSFAGWKGDTRDSFRIEAGAIVAGNLDETQPRMEYLATTAEYENFDLSFQYRLEGTQYLNTGVYFRSAFTGPGKIIGYQADIGEGYDGGLFEEGRGRGVLTVPPADLRKKVVKPNAWNDYRVRAEGRRFQIWINNQLMTDYIDRDRRPARRGAFAIELSANMRGVIRFRNFELEELPSTAAEDDMLVDQPAGRITRKLRPPPKYTGFTNGVFRLEPDEVVVFTGSENMVTEQREGMLETLLTQQYARARPRFRHMSFEGDTVWRQNRMQNWGSWRENLDAVDASLVFVWLGQMEAFDSGHTPEEFATAYAALIDQFSQRTPRLVLISPPPFEKLNDPNLPDNTPRNALLAQYAQSIQKLAEERGLVYVDLFTILSNRRPPAPLTRDGCHFTPAGSREVARIIARQLGVSESQEPKPEVQTEIVEKNRLWFDTWRCMNWAFAYGDRTTQPFAQGASATPPFVEELAAFQPLVAHADARIAARVDNKPLPDPLPEPPARANPPAATPAEEQSRFVIRDGFEVNLFADETLGVTRPLQIRWDEAGRLWVLCAPSYPQLQPGQKANDYIVRLEDTDGDGRADTSTRVAEGLTMPMGFEFGDGGLYVCESTQLVHLHDSNRDGMLDSRRVILSGFGTGDSHQNINSIRWGADGCLWFSQGYHIWSYVETAYGLVELNRSGLWRLNPRTWKLDSFLNESTAGLNCWGVAFDDHGQFFHASGANVAVWHSTPALIPTLHVLSLGPGLAISRGKSMEPEFLGSSHLPDELQGALLKSTYFTNQVQLYRLHDEGSGFKSEDLGDLISSTGTEFRPLETRVGPDGAIYICDWLNPVIGHYQASYRDPRRDLSHGRIWRMTARDRPLVTRPLLEQMSAAELVSQLDSPERWVRDAAKFRLYRLPREQVLAAADVALALEPGLTDSGCRRLYELSGVFSAHEAPRLDLVTRLLASTDFRWRAWGVRLVGYWQQGLPEALTLVERAAEDEHPRVRLEAVVAAAAIPDERSIVAATRVLDRPVDFGIDYALTQCIFQLEPNWQPALAAGRLDFQSRVPALVRVLTTVGGENVVPLVNRLLDSGNVAGTAREGLLGVLAESGTASDVQRAVETAGSSPLVLDSLLRTARRRKLENGDALARVLLGANATSPRVAAAKLIELWRLSAFGPQMEQVLSDRQRDPDERAAAVGAVAALRGETAVAVLEPLIRDPEPTVRHAVLAGLARREPKFVAREAARLLADVESAADVAPLFRPLLELREGPAILAAALEESKPDATAARKALQWMGEAGFDASAVLASLDAAAGITAQRQEFSEILVRELVERAQSTGDVARGETLFRSDRATCLKCHRLGDTGGKQGPDLTAIGRSMTPEAVVESVLWPKRQVKEGFLLSTVLTSAGTVLNGYKERETDQELTLRDPATGDVRFIRKSDIEERQDAGTLMPEGLTDWMTETDRLDLLRFLMTRGK